MRVDLNLYTQNKVNTTNFKHKMPTFIVDDGHRILTNDEYPIYIFKIINGIKNSKGFKMFFDKFNVQKITLWDFSSNAIPEFFTSVRIHQPRLRITDSTRKKSMYEKLVDYLISDSNINYGEKDDFSLLFHRYDDDLEKKVQNTSYYELKKALKLKQKEIDKDNRNEALKKKLSKELKSDQII
ncbi:hypothetical protein IJ384_05705 [bacterium]|nr:hypothetical protein [bacterium]